MKQHNKTYIRHPASGVTVIGTKGAGRTHEEMQWETAADWGRKIHVSRTIFESYLIELGYLEHDYHSHGKRNKLVVTEMGRNHSATTNSPFSKAILWDFDTFAEVVKMRASQAIVHNTCPKCRAYLDTMPDYNHLDYSHTCKRCGRICDYWHANVIFDR